ncbi:hypothetical protein [Dactylosporangium sp. CA-233914]|uniref:hypothetical protein n=1 Tax=Dactylosporangium sp. CA-233914 TaxID=3239934 RepID=UPI003D94DF9D
MVRRTHPPQATRRSIHRSVKDLETGVTALIAAWNVDPKPFVWVKTADRVLDNLVNYGTSLNQLINDLERSQATPSGQRRPPNADRVHLLSILQLWCRGTP